MDGDDLPQAGEVLDFWIGAGAEKWFEKNPALDAEIARRFTALNAAAIAGLLDHWVGEAAGALALIIAIDQFSRNLNRDSPRAFAGDAKARALADAALARGHDQKFEVPLRRFFYMPYMHGETLEAQRKCLVLCQASGDQEGVRFAREHADIIARFGRFPHRNTVLGRATTPAEQAFLDAGGFTG